MQFEIVDYCFKKTASMHYPGDAYLHQLAIGAFGSEL